MTPHEAIRNVIVEVVSMSPDEWATAIIGALREANYVIVPRYRCDTCNRSFDSMEAKQRHRLDKHTPHRKLSAQDRPANLGPIPCGCDGCNQSFGSEWNAAQHRLMIHGVSLNIQQRQEPK